MNITAVKPPKRYGIIVKGPHEAFVDAFYRWMPAARPPADVHMNGYGAFHCNVWLDDPQPLHDWFANGDLSSGTWRPGDLSFFFSPD